MKFDKPYWQCCSNTMYQSFGHVAYNVTLPGDSSPLQTRNIVICIYVQFERSVGKRPNTDWYSSGK